MGPTSVERKLTAILSADVKGYSRLMGEDEVATIRTLTAYRELMASLIQQHRGRVVDTVGDNLLADFVSVVDSVQCGVGIQQELTTKNAELPDNRKMEFRIGINLGDVVVKGEDIYGDGVNIAARLESLAEPGGICISGTVYDSIRHKLSLEYEYLGEQSVKNIKEPVRVFRVLTQTEAEARAPVRARRALASSWRKLGLTIAGLLFLVGGAIAAWNLYFSPSVSQRDTASEKRLPLPEKPSIAVLPLPT